MTPGEGWDHKKQDQILTYEHIEEKDQREKVSSVWKHPEIVEIHICLNHDPWVPQRSNILRKTFKNHLIKNLFVILF